jgi:hypothetical protein
MAEPKLAATCSARSIYESDYYRWLKLRQPTCATRDAEALDGDNAAEEMAGRGRS